MTKTKNPLLSFEAHGSIGNTITHQRRARRSFARTTPSPTDPKTLAQVYQRWLYQDYVSLWLTLSTPQKQFYHSQASRHHMTGFAYYMSIQLRTLPDISVAFHFDRIANGLTPDLSRNNNDGVVFGASPYPGYLAGCLSFDGIDNRVVVPTNPSIQNYTAKTVLLRFKAVPFTGDFRFFHDNGYYTSPYGDLITLHKTSDVIQTFLKNTANITQWSQISFIPYIWNTTGYTWDGTTVNFYLNGYSWASLPFSGTLACSPYDLFIGCRSPLISYYDGLLDEFRTYNRCLSPQDVLAYHVRRYPL